jgi:aerobic-type carbon monoxide dehydrogenase small subunit (CoxS/CutS family)
MKLNINGEQRMFDDPPREMSLLWVLRDLLGHQDVKFGCGEGHCRCCTVLVDGEARPSCQLTGRHRPRIAVNTAASHQPSTDPNTKAK